MGVCLLMFKAAETIM